MPANPFSPEEDRLLAATPYGELKVLAERLGRSISVLSKRQKRLVGAVAGGRPLTRRAAPVPRGRREGTVARFARPAWFDEDLSVMTKGAL